MEKERGKKTAGDYHERTRPAPPPPERGPTFPKLAACDYFAIIKGLIGLGRGALGGASPPRPFACRIDSSLRLIISLSHLVRIFFFEFIFQRHRVGFCCSSFVLRNRFRVCICHLSRYGCSVLFSSLTEDVLKYLLIPTSIRMNQTLSRREGKSRR